MAKIQKRLTVSVAEAGQRLGIGRNHAYECVRSGELPVIRLGGKMVVSVAVLEHMLAPPQKPPASKVTKETARRRPRAQPSPPAE
jgi:excisionase family DNA binding protein